MTANVMMALGGYRFSLPTAAYDSLARTHRWRWGKQERIGRPPAFQFLGRGEETIQLQGRIYPYFKGGLGQIRAMRAEADKAVPLMLVDGLGAIWGKYVISELEETQRYFDKQGIPRRQDFSLKLLNYGDDQ